MRTIRLLAAAVLMIACGHAAADKPARPDREADVYKEKQTGLAFARRIGQLVREKTMEFSKAELGVGIQYRDGKGMLVSIYVYNLGLSEIPAEANAEVIKKHLQHALGDIREMARRGTYQDLAVEKSQIVALTTEEGSPKSHRVVLTYRVKGVKARSYLYVMGYRNHFVKIRATCPAESAEAAEKQLTQLMAYLGRNMRGWVKERLGRALIARALDGDKVYLGWRLLQADPKNVAFNVYRRAGGGNPVRLTTEPLRKTTDFVDAAPPAGKKVQYTVRPVVEGKEAPPSRGASPASGAYISLKLKGNYTFQKVGIADLDGDGRYDFVIKQPRDNIDPWHKYWKKSPETYKLEAYRHDGKFMWRYDMGWAIERGIWYSPYVVYDLDGDGKAEVAVKTGKGDPRGADGKVQEGPEYVTILDGLTGKVRAQADWPSRKHFTGQYAYNYASRNQLCVAYLDGKTPFLIVERGTYNIMIADAYEFRAGKLRMVWRWTNKGQPRKYWGQGAHWMHAADVDGDGREEVLLGSAVIDDNGQGLWSTGLGHPDHFYVGDLDPRRPGLEIYYGIEPGRSRNAMCMVDAKTGKILWGHDKQTRHIHSSGLASDIDARHPGAECYSGERDLKDKRWLRDSRGKVLSTADLGGLSPRAAYWDADPQRELVVRGRISKYGGRDLPPRVEGSVVAIADILGDWREEIITSVSGEMRIYTTTVPATDRRPCLMQDPIYRADVICAAMGYYQVPMLSYDLATRKK